jgi:hypothetical protein
LNIKQAVGNYHQTKKAITFFDKKGKGKRLELMFVTIVDLCKIEILTPVLTS